MLRKLNQRRCLDVKAIAAFVAGGGRPDARVAARVARHLDRCSWCARQVAVASSSSSSPPTSTSGTIAGRLGQHRGPEAAAVVPVGGTLLGRYQVRGLIGRGGMGEVYEGYDLALERKVALKLLRREAASDGRRLQGRLGAEARAMAKIRSANVVSVHDAGTAGDRPFVVMELVEGTTLASWMRAQAHAGGSWRPIVRAFLAAGEGLAAVHAAGVVHRDFKPENVFVGDDGSVRVGDFGLATSTSFMAPARAAGGGPANDVDGRVLGTPRYMAPEQFLGDPTDARTDQFAFCVALYEGLTGRHPFPAPSLDALKHAVLGGHVLLPPRSARLPRPLTAAVLRGLARSRADRFPSMRPLLDILHGTLTTPPADPFTVATATTLFLTAIATAIWYALAGR
jgi:eukaryotic-like serine/threonine-protein kinase